MISGLFETHLAVSDLARSMDFYGRVLGLELAHRDATRPVTFYWIGQRGGAMLGLWEKPPDQILPQHFAFRSTPEQILEQSAAWLSERNLRGYNFLRDETGPMVFAWMPAVAIYFRDPDGHELELIAMLDDAPRPEEGVVSWERWRELVDRR